MILRLSRESGAAMFAVFALTSLFMVGGCAVSPVVSQNQSNAHVVAERDLLIEAARDVEQAPWPAPQQVSFVARIAGAADDDRITRSDAAEIYVSGLQPAGLRFATLANDARANLVAADRLSLVASNAISSARITMNDVVTVEGAIQALRTNRKIYTSAVHKLEQIGEPVDDDEVDEIRTAYSVAIRNLGDAADALAERIEKDRTETIAAPSRMPAGAPKNTHKLSGV